MCNDTARSSSSGPKAAVAGQHCSRAIRTHNCIGFCCGTFGPVGEPTCAAATASCKHITDGPKPCTPNGRSCFSSRGTCYAPVAGSWHQTARLLLMLQLLLSVLLSNSEASRQLNSPSMPHSTHDLQDIQQPHQQQQQQQQPSRVAVQGDPPHSSRSGRTLSVAWLLQAGRDATGTSGSSSSSDTAASSPPADTVQSQQQHQQQPPQQDSDAASIAAMLEQMQRPQVMISDLQLPAESAPAAPPAGSTTNTGTTGSPAPGSTVSPASSTTSTVSQAAGGPAGGTTGNSNASVPPPAPPATLAPAAAPLTLPILPGRRLALQSSSSGSRLGRQLQQAPAQATYGGALCSATINYGASVGDASKRGTAEVPIFVGSFDVAVTSQQQQKAAANSSWVLGWQFTAGEHIQQLRDVFGDDGIYNVHILPDAATVAAGGGPQGIAVFSNSSLAGQQSQGTFSFVGRKGPPGLALDAAPFRVAPPSHLFLNNHFCWPLLRPSPSAVTAADGSNSNSTSVHVGMRGGTALIEESSRVVPVYGQGGDTAVGEGEEGVGVAGVLQQQQQQQQWAAVAVPQLPGDAMPRALMVEYLPVEFTEAEGPGLFAKNLTQFYIKLSNRQPSANSEPVFLDQVLLQYWFHGPNEPVTSSANAVGGNSSSEGDAVVALVAGQFRMGCSDATAGIGCDGIAWNITAGLPEVYGARFVLNIWFPANTSTSSSGNNVTRRMLLLPNDTTLTNASNSVVKQRSADGSMVEIQAIQQLEAILMLDYRRFFASIHAKDDYSYLETGVVPSSNRTSSSSSKPIVRRVREPNPQLPAFLNSRLAWGSPPVGAERPDNATAADDSTASNAAGPIYPPGSYCQRTADGGLVCGVDMLYCCFGAGPLSSTPPADWEQWLRPPDSTGGTGSTVISGNPSDPDPSRSPPQQQQIGSTAAGGSGGGDPSTPPSGQQQQQQQMQPYVVALIAVVPIVVLVSAALLYGVTYWAKREIRRNASAGSAGSGGGEASSNGQVPLVLHDVAGSGGSDQQDSLLSNNSRIEGAGKTLLRALLSPRGRRSAGLTDSCYVGTNAAELGGKTGTGAAGYDSPSGKLWMLCFKGSSADAQAVLLRSSPQPLLTAAVVNGRNDTAMEPGAATAAVAASGSSMSRSSSIQQQQQQSAGPHAVSIAAAVPAAGASVAGSDSRVISSSLYHHQQQQGLALRGDNGLLLQQLDGLIDASGHPVTSDVLTPEQLAFVYLQQSPNLLWHVRAARGRTLPESMLSRAINQMQQLQQQQPGLKQQQQQSPRGLVQSPVGGRISSNSSLLVSGSFSRSGCRNSSSPAHAEGYVKRHATWNGRLSDDAFAEDPMGHLLNLQLDRQLNPDAGINSPGNLGASLGDAADHITAASADRITPYHPTGPTFAGAGAAAVEAAVAAINAAITSSALQRQQQQQQLVPGSTMPLKLAGGLPAHSVMSSLIPSPASFSGAQAPSFYTALMETGGIIKPPGGGAAIPLNVDFAAEIQPHLGKLLGKGGFGAVYEATWRGKKVAVKLLTVDTEEPAVLDAFLKEVALCACLRGCSRVVHLLGACLGGVGGTAPAAATAAAESAATAAANAVAASRTSIAAGSSAVKGGASAAVQEPAAHSHAPHNTSEAHEVAAMENGQQSAAAGGAAIDAAAGDVASKLSALSDGQQQQQHGQQQQRQLALIMELVEGGNLAQRIYNPSKRRLTYLEILQVALDVTTGLAYLHPAVVHRDLKPQNVLLDKQGRAKIADFGISRFKDPTRSYLSVTHQGGTPNYMAPELFNGTRVDEAADVYSLGCILYECVTRRQPFSHLAADARSFNVLFKIIVAVAINKERPPLPHDTPPRLAALIERCWLEDPAHRPRVAQLATELQDMMQEELHARAEKLSRLRRLSSRTHSLPSQSSIQLPGITAGSSTGAPADSDAAIASASGRSDGNSSGGSSRRNSVETPTAYKEPGPANISLMKTKSEGAAVFAPYFQEKLPLPPAAPVTALAEAVAAEGGAFAQQQQQQHRTSSTSSTSSSVPMLAAAAAPLAAADAAVPAAGPSNSFTEPLSFLTSSNTSFRTAASTEFAAPPAHGTARWSSDAYVVGRSVAATAVAPTSASKPMLPSKLLGLVPLRWRCPQDQQQQQQHLDKQRLLMPGTVVAADLNSSTITSESRAAASTSAGPETPGRLSTSTSTAAADEVLGWQKLVQEQQLPLQVASSLMAAQSLADGGRVSSRLSSGQPGTPSGPLSGEAASFPREFSDVSSVTSFTSPAVVSGQPGNLSGPPSGQPGDLAREVSGQSTEPPPPGLSVSCAASSSNSSDQVPRRSTASVLDRSISNNSNASAVSDGGACADTSSVASSSLFVSVKAGGRQGSSTASCSSAWSSYQGPAAVQHKQLQLQQLEPAVLQSTASSDVNGAHIAGSVTESVVCTTASSWQQQTAMASATVELASDDEATEEVSSVPAVAAVAGMHAAETSFAPTAAAPVRVAADVARHSSSSSGSGAAATGRASSSSGSIQRKVSFALP